MKMKIEERIKATNDVVQCTWTGHVEDNIVIVEAILKSEHPRFRKSVVLEYGLDQIQVVSPYIVRVLLLKAKVTNEEEAISILKIAEESFVKKEGPFFYTGRRGVEEAMDILHVYGPYVYSPLDTKREEDVSKTQHWHDEVLVFEDVPRYAFLLIQQNGKEITVKMTDKTHQPNELDRRTFPSVFQASLAFDELVSKAKLGQLMVGGGASV